jgi:predicted nucleic acid-binding protein
MKSAFLDTSYLLALELANDQQHEVVLQHWQYVIAEGLPRLVTTSYILSEVVTYLNSRDQHAKAVSIGNMLLQSNAVDLIHVDAALFEEAWEYFQRHEDKTYSLTDCVSFIVMAKQDVRHAFALDRHFVQAGFVVEP